MAKNSPSIVDVAKRSSTSVSTVSYAFSNKRPLSKETKSRILNIAKQIGYKPNILASNFRKGKTDILGLMLDTLNSPFFAYWATCLENAAREKGYRVCIANTNGDPKLANCYLDEFESMRVGAVVVSTAAVSDEQIRRIYKNDKIIVTPVRVIDGILTSPVDVDYSFGVEQVINYLFSLGHRNIGFIAGPADDPTSQSRLESFKMFCRLNGINADPSHIVYGREGIGVGAEEAKRLLDSSRGLTAIFSSCDAMAFAAMHAVASLGLRVPEDISIVGYDDIPYSALWHPALTTVSIDIPAMAKIVIDCIVCDNPKDFCRNKAVIKPKLIVRDTCAAVKSN